MISDLLSYKDDIIAAREMDKSVYLRRLQERLAKGGLKAEDKAIFLAAKVVAEVWNALDMKNPFYTAAMKNPQTPREEVETGVAIMAKGLHGVINGLEADARRRAMIVDSMSGLSNTQGLKKRSCRHLLERGGDDMKIKAALTAIKDLFEVFLPAAETYAAKEPEGNAVLSKLQENLRPFLAQRKSLYPRQNQGKGQGRK